MTAGTPARTCAMKASAARSKSSRSLSSTRRLSRWPLTAPPPLVEVCMRMMSKQPDARYQSAEEVSRALATWLRSRGREVVSGVDAARRALSRRPGRRRRFVVARRDRSGRADCRRRHGANEGSTRRDSLWPRDLRSCASGRNAYNTAGQHERGSGRRGSAARQRPPAWCAD